MPGVSSGFPPSFRQGRRPFWGGDRGSDGCQEPEPLCWGPQLIPSPGGRGPEGAGRRAGGAPCSSAHLSQSAQAQVKLGGSAERPQHRLTGQEGRAVHPRLRFWTAGLDRAQVAQGTCTFNLFLFSSGARHPHRPWPLTTRR